MRINDSSISPVASEHPIENSESGEVRRVLSQILASQSFRNSKQCSSMLLYIVEHSLAGDENLLRERVIGSHVFGRPADYETNEDPVVRLRASEVRKRLAQYYLTDPDPTGVYIEIPSGGYRATFHSRKDSTSFPIGMNRETFSTEAPAASQTSHGVEQPKVPFEAVSSADPSIEPSIHLPKTAGRKRGWLRVAAVAAVLLLLAAAAMFTVMRANSHEKTFRAFWAPWMSSTKPVIISVGSNAVYRVKDEYVDRYAKEQGLENQGRELYVPFGNNATLPAAEIYPAQSSFVALGDVAAISNIVATLTREKRSFQERFPNDVSFAELRDTPSVLVGGFNNPMTLELTRHLEFVMRSGKEIDDTLNPNRKWLLNASADSHDTADYAIITRLVQRNGDAPIISVAGLGQYGTLGAAILICNPEEIHRVTDELPKGWADRNLEVVLRIAVLDFKPTTPVVVAYRSW